MIHFCKYIRKYHFSQTIMNQLYNIILAADNETLRLFSRKKNFFACEEYPLRITRKCGDLHLMNPTNFSLLLADSDYDYDYSSKIRAMKM